MNFYHKFKRGDRVKTICEMPIKGTVLGYVDNIDMVCSVLTDDDFIGNWLEEDLYSLKESRKTTYIGSIINKIKKNYERTNTRLL